MLHCEAIDRIILPVEDCSAAIQPFARLGCRIVPHLEASGNVPGSRSLFFGDQHRLFRVEIAGPDPEHPLDAIIREAIKEKQGLCTIVLRVKNLALALHDLSKRGVGHTMLPAAATNGSKVEAAAKLAVDEVAGVPLVLCESPLTAEDRHADVIEHDGLNHALPIRRLDHLASVARNLEEQTHFWIKFLEIPLLGEVVTPTMIIRQFKVGDAIIELLGPASADSPLHSRTPGLISMMSLEVSDLPAAVEYAKNAGFGISSPTKGVLPRTITATIPAAETSGLALQLLQYTG